MEHFVFRNGRKRINGFSFPLHRDQIVSSILYLLCTVGHFLICCIFLPSPPQYIIIPITSCLVIVTVASWIAASIINPEHCANDNHMPLWCGRREPRITRMCFECQKTVLEFDHHCSFLNNCIGSKNYTAFICLLMGGTFQMIVHTFVLVAVQTKYLNNIAIKQALGKLWLFYFLLGMEAVVTGTLAIGFICLVVFHFYLYFVVKLGTCDWVLHRRQMRAKAYTRSSSNLQSVRPFTYTEDNSGVHDSPNVSDLSVCRFERVESVTV